MTDIGDGPFHQGEPIWVMEADGSQRPAEYVGVREVSAWFGGAPSVFVLYTDTRAPGVVEVDRVIPRAARARRLMQSRNTRRRQRARAHPTPSAGRDSRRVS